MLNWPRSEDLQGSRWGGFIRFVKFLIEFGVQCHSLSDHAAWTIIKTSAPFPHALGRRWPPHFLPPSPTSLAAQAKGCQKTLWSSGQPQPSHSAHLASSRPTDQPGEKPQAQCLFAVGWLSGFVVCLLSFSFFFFIF